jgi:hypothetical protein
MKYFAGLEEVTVFEGCSASDSRLSNSLVIPLVHLRGIQEKIHA